MAQEGDGGNVGFDPRVGEYVQAAIFSPLANAPSTCSGIVYTKTPEKNTMSVVVVSPGDPTGTMFRICKLDTAKKREFALLPEKEQDAFKRIKKIVFANIASSNIQ